MLDARRAPTSPRCLHEELRPARRRATTQLKARAGKLDFLDLLARARATCCATTPRVRAELQRRFTHLFVDEFQDTDPLQAEILLLLAADDPGAATRRRASAPGKLFVVGDPKQSIYRFRRADVALYEAIKQRLARAAAPSSLHLTTSFRSAPAIQARGQRRVRAGDAGGERQPGALRAARRRAAPTSPAQPARRRAARAAPVRRLRQGHELARSRSRYPDAVGAFVDWLVDESGWTVTERDGASAVPIERAPRLPALQALPDASASDVTRAVRARARGARASRTCSSAAARSTSAKRCIALRNALARDRVARRRALGLRHAARPVLRARRRRAARVPQHAAARLHPLPAASTTQRSPSDARGRRRARRARASCTAAATAGRSPTRIARLLEATRAHAGHRDLADRRAGARQRAARDRPRARASRRGGATSFRAFVERLDDDAERGSAGRGARRRGGHRGRAHHDRAPAKGLEFPVVILSIRPRRSTHASPSRYVDRRRAACGLEPLAGCVPVELRRAREEVLRARSRGGRAPRLRRGDARARSARRAGRRRRGARRAGSTSLDAGRSTPIRAQRARADAGAGLPAVRRRQRARSRRPSAPQPDGTRSRRACTPRAPASTRWCGGIRTRSSSTARSTAGCASSRSSQADEAACRDGERARPRGVAGRARAARWRSAARAEPRSCARSTDEATRELAARRDPSTIEAHRRSRARPPARQALRHLVHAVLAASISRDGASAAIAAQPGRGSSAPRRDEVAAGDRRRRRRARASAAAAAPRAARELRREAPVVLATPTATASRASSTSRSSRTARGPSSTSRPTPSSARRAPSTRPRSGSTRARSRPRPASPPCRACCSFDV